MNTSCSVTLKYIDLSYILNGSSAQERFCNIIHRSFEKHLLLRVMQFSQKLTDFLKQYHRLTLVIITAEVIRKFFKYWEAVLITRHGS